MANLLNTPTTVEEVKEIQSAARGISTSKNEDILIQDLDAMITAIKASETKLYNSLQCNGYKDFQRKIKSVEQYDELLANGAVFRYFSSRYSFPVGRKVEEAAEDLEELVNGIFQNNPAL